MASLTASLVRNMSTGRPDSAAPTATRNATVTFSGSSRPVVKLMTALPDMDVPPCARGLGLAPCEQHVRDGGAGCRPGFSLQIDWAQAVKQAMLHGEQGGGRAGRGPGLGVDPLDVGFGRLGRDAEGAGDLPGGCAAGDEGEHLDLARG